ncbi:hypothetical protein M231_05218 [Tremella mesenterica]|uniref:Mitochondrial carrier protein n=1 Tax=Tremella mesenterica TaxID=5217 RepID=A0A4V1M3N6_TREME|nr:hypothetical protein M231_05218 [Tremella mesenterica]
MESLVDVITTSFQAVVAVCVVFTAGYSYAGSKAPEIGQILRTVTGRVLLPCQILVVLASSPSLTWRSLLLAAWPILVLSLTVHAASVVYGLVLWRYAGSPHWIIGSSTYSNISSYPLLLVQMMYMISRVSSLQGLWHLKWRSMEDLDQVYERVVLYIILNLLFTAVIRCSSIRVGLLHVIPKRKESINVEEETSNGADVTAEPESMEDVTENTPLIASSDPKPRSEVKLSSRLGKIVTPASIAALLGLLIGLIKPVQRALVGTVAGDKQLTGVWESVGFGLAGLGGTYAVLEMLAIGSSIRAAEAKPSSEERIPPSLGTVLLLTFWRYILVPIISLSIIHGFRKIPSTHAFLQDPAFSFVLGLSTITPPSFALPMTPFRSAVHYNLTYVALITPVPLAVLFAISGRGVSYAVDFDLLRALKSAAGGGLAGAAAMVLQVLLLMPLRTQMNYQYRHGGKLKDVIKTLWSEGGIRRFYAGMGAALFQAPLSRFGDTAANAGILALLNSFQWPVLIKTVAASLASACFRMTLTPIDTLKTTQQTQGGKEGLRLLRQRIKENGVGCLWWGALATAAATFVGHYPWFGTYNYLSDVLPQPHNIMQKLARQAFIGFSASVVSDTVSNSLRVVKTYRQVHEKDVGYWTAAKDIVASDGLLALFGRGLPVRLATNGLQGLIFSILWKLFTDMWVSLPLSTSEADDSILGGSK